MAWNNIPPNGFPQIPDIEDLEAVVKDVTTLKAAKAAKADIAPEFSATSNYAVGDLVYHEGTLYVCSTAHTAAAWNAEHFTASSVASELSGISGDISDLSSTKANQITIAPFFNPETAYEVGDLVYYNGLSYRCTNDHEGAWDADDFAATTIANELSGLKSGLTNVESSITTLAGKVRFYPTLSGDVLGTIKGSPQNTITFYINSNNPAKQPSGCSWGSYIIFKGDTAGSVIYVDSAHIACAYALSDNSEDITWHIT